MGKYLLLLFVITSTSTKAQSWCTPGSEWHFNHNMTFQYGGYKKLTYLYDTVIGSVTCNKIRSKTVAAFPFAVNNIFYYYTYTSNKVVYIKDIMNSTQNFDTLFNFNAPIGSKWRMAPTSLTNCAASYVTVQDTGSNIIQGQNLKWLKLHYLHTANQFSVSMVDTIYERLGAKTVFPYYFGNICPFGTDMGGDFKLRCFSDNQIINYKNNWTDSCAHYLTSVAEENLIINTIRIWPNLIADKLIINNGYSLPQTVNLILRDILGKETLHEETLIVNEHTLNLSQLKQGIYFLQIGNTEKGWITEKVVKE